ncbi:MAG: tetratricopeptide repeat-containing serine/threonine-protein kinase, partial [Holophagales bacterium]|nr:tetratricopeptide repeat-containing serine/threonine-protein kinase [Holophagales bacterium]
DLAALSGEIAQVPDFTATGEILGTLLYMSPEQARGEPVTPATDVFSLGLILHELLSGEAAYAPSLHRVDLLEVIQEGRVPPLPGLGAHQADLLQRLTAPAPRTRPSARDAAERLRFLLAAPQRRRRRILRGMAVASLLALTALSAWQARRTSFEAAKAERAAEEARAETARANEAALAAERMTELVIGMFQAVDSWNVVRPSTPQGRQATAADVFLRGLRELDVGLEADPEMRARVLLAAAEVAVGLELWPQAREVLQQALDLRRGLHGSRHSAVAEALTQLANVHYYEGTLERGLELAVEAVSILRGSGDEAKSELAEALIEKARIALDLGTLPEAEVAAREALALGETVWPRPSAEVAEIEVLVGVILTIRGEQDLDSRRLEASLELLESALGDLTTLLGTDHPVVARARSSAAWSALLLGRTSEALEQLEAVLDRYREVLGDSARETTLQWRRVGQAKRLAGRAVEADAIQRRVVELIEAQSGPDHLDLLSPLREWALARLALGDPESAEEHLRWALRLALDAYPPDNWETRELRVWLGAALREQGRFSEAESSLLQALDAEPGTLAKLVEHQGLQELEALYARWQPDRPSGTITRPATGQSESREPRPGNDE